MYWLFEYIEAENYWKEIGYGTCAKALEAHAITVGVEVWGIVGW